MTGRDAVAAALRLIGAVAAGETPAAQESSDGLSSLNRMINSWSAEGLLIHAITAESPLTLTAGDGAYTLGTSGDITTRPQEIVAAVIRDASNSLDQPVKILSASEYAALPDKTAQADYPTSLYDDGGYPQRTITLYPVPAAAHKLVLYTKRALTEISTLDTSVSLPPGYDDAIVFNLAMRLAPEYGRTVPDAVAVLATEAKASVKRGNRRPSYLRVDLAIQGIGGFDINGGGFT
jgi:hypothetical protein